jgi:hypothetical protein
MVLQRAISPTTATLRQVVRSTPATSASSSDTV